VSRFFQVTVAPVLTVNAIGENMKFLITTAFDSSA
jgi:hypothetical protein